jgi:hypothetical protein
MQEPQWLFRRLATRCVRVCVLWGNRIAPPNSFSVRSPSDHRETFLCYSERIVNSTTLRWKDDRDGVSAIQIANEVRNIRREWDANCAKDDDVCTCRPNCHRSREDGGVGAADVDVELEGDGDKGALGRDGETRLGWTTGKARDADRIRCRANVKAIPENEWHHALRPWVLDIQTREHRVYRRGSPTSCRATTVTEFHQVFVGPLTRLTMDRSASSCRPCRP